MLKKEKMFRTAERMKNATYTYTHTHTPRIAAPSLPLG